MALTAPLTIRQHTFAAKLEATTGTAISLAAADGTMNVFATETNIIKPNIPSTARQGQGSYSPLKPLAAARAADIAFRTEMIGGASAPKWAELLTASGFTASSLVYTVTSGSATAATMTVGHYRDGSRLKQAAGCMFNLKMTGQNGMPVYCDWAGKGKWIAPSTVAMIAPTYDTTLPPVCESVVMTIGGTSYTLPGFEIDLGNEVILRPDITDATGYLAAYITNRNVTVSVSPEALGYGTKDWGADFIASTTAALSIAVGTTGNKVVITAPALALTSAPEDEDRDGVLADKLVFTSVRSASVGDDDLVITFS